jgi:hypothetical protein
MTTPFARLDIDSISTLTIRTQVETLAGKDLEHDQWDYTSARRRRHRVDPSAAEVELFEIRSDWIEHVAVRRAAGATARLHHPSALGIQLFGLWGIKPGEAQFIRNIRRALDRHMAVVPK